MAETTQAQVKVGWAQTTTGILIKRLFFNAVAQITLVLYNELTAGHVDWEKVKYAAAIQLLYIVMTAARDLGDTKLPNTPNDTKTVEVVA